MMKVLLLLMATLNLAATAADSVHSDQIVRVLNEDEPFMGEAGAINVEQICAAYMASGALSCECEREGTKSVLMDCLDIEPTCTLGNETCIFVRFETVLDPITPVEQGSPYMITCTDWVTEERRTETCVEIQPDTVGKFNESVECGASLNGEVCKSCSQCGGYDYTTISVDCTNLEDNAKMTCGNVTDNGLAVLLFDAGYSPPPESAASSMGAMLALGSLLASSLIYMFW